MDESFWHFAHLNPEPTTLQRMTTQNVVTGATMMINAALRERVGAIPGDAAVHDWWIACVASAFGTIIAVVTPTMLYRQHDTNTIGARRSASTFGWRELAGGVHHAVLQASAVRAGIAMAARQAGAFAERYGASLPAGERDFLLAYARIPGEGFFRRKIGLLRLHLLTEKGFLRNVGVLLRA
jgi:hypothetical protein